MDITFPKKSNNKLIVFSHGFKGFKDWGCFNLISKSFTQNGFTFLKFNFSHNGTTIADPLNFNDLEAFGNNNFSIELNDLSLVLDWSVQNLNISDITLLGHSRGGGIAMLKTAEDRRIDRVVSWASPSNFLNKFSSDEKLAKWKETDVAYIYNGRTKQNMPMFFQFYKNCQENKNRLNIENAVRKMSIPHLVVHGSDDPTVLITEAKAIKNWNANVNLHIIKGANHVLGGFHPYDLEKFPKDLKN